MPSKSIPLANNNELESHTRCVATVRSSSVCNAFPCSAVCSCLGKENSCELLRNSAKMDQPFQYVNKVLSNVTDNSRSQSLPDCLDIVKKTCVLSEDCSYANSDLPSVESTSVVENVANPDVLKSNEAWFKTWPERGSEKIGVNTNADSATQQDKSKEFLHNDECASNLTGCKVSLGNVNSTNSQISDLPASSVLRHVRNGCVDNICRMNEIVKCRTGNVTNTPSTFCDNSTYSVKRCENADVNSGKNSIPLTEILQSMPLAYSPVTRQLHIISSEENEGKEKFNCCQSDVHSDSYPLKAKTAAPRCRCEANFQRQLNGECEDAVSFGSPCSTIQRMGAYENSQSHTDASSFSSIVSSLSDASPSVNEDAPAVDDDGKIHCGGGQESLSSSDISICEENSPSKFKRRGISGFFSRCGDPVEEVAAHVQRGVFSWRREGGGPGCSQPAWRLWGTRTQSSVPVPAAAAAEDSQGDTTQFTDVVASSSALILHRRPSNLPAKCPDEEQKHRHEYQRMVEAARKKELKEAKLRKKQLAQQLRQEEQLAQAARVWSSEILPKWDLMKNSRKAKDLWWQGLPPSVRGRVWQLAIGNDLNITPQLYEICVARAQERLRVASEELQQEYQQGAVDGGESPDKESSVELIQLDISRTFPHLCIFQKGGPYYDILHSLLGAYVCYRPDVGYVQGMSFIAAVLILNMEPADAFICFANLLNQPCHMAFFRLNQTVMNSYYETYNCVFRENLPRLHAHFSSANLSADLYLIDWLYTVFAKAMPLDVACRVWDVFLRDGEEFLFKTALGVLHLHQDVLLQLDFLHGAQFLTRLPDDLAADRLFRSIESIRMSVGKLRFSEVLASHVEPS